MKKKALEQKEGSALLIAIVIMMVLTMLTLALLLVSYSLFATANKQQGMEQCKEMAQSLSRELEEEITGTDVDFSTYDEMKTAYEAGESPLWFYLRFNLWQSDWPYYNEEERGHTAAYAYRYFDINTGTGKEAVADALDDISVKMYWEGENDAEKEDTSFVVQVTCQKGKLKSIITSTYELTIDENPANYGGAGEEMLDGKHLIQTGEKWTFSLAQRE